ncbi:MAG: hypothetical protein WCR06_07375 [bacterium]
MKVQKQRAVTEPGYPSRRQWSQYGRHLAGVATIGLGAAVGRSGEDMRLRGDIAVEPRAPVKPAQPLGIPRIESCPSGTSTNLPVAATNHPPVTAASTNKPMASPQAPVQKKGNMPAEPR